MKNTWIYLVICCLILCFAPRSVSVVGAESYEYKNTNYSYFNKLPSGDAWGAKIKTWQKKALNNKQKEDNKDVGSGIHPNSATITTNGYTGIDLEYRRFVREQKLIIANNVFLWMKQKISSYFINDGKTDSWPTLEEVLYRGGDDCDGLELISLQILRHFGFSDDELYRGIVKNLEENTYHMVTFWFENKNNPWVIDPTGVMGKDQLFLMSEATNWVPIRVFNEKESYMVKRLSK